MSNDLDWLPIVIIGGGASGVLMAYHLIKRTDANLPVVIVEESRDLGFGLAFGTRNPSHLLNVRNANMSADPDDPDHFMSWRARDAGIALGGIDPSGFSSRATYGRYMFSLIAPYRAEGRLLIARNKAVGVAETNRGVVVRLTDGTEIEGRSAVIATGHDTSCLSHFENPWRAHEAGTRAPSDCVLVAGTGLTMVDYILTLLDAGHAGPIHAVSRRGLLPNPHRSVQPHVIAREELPGGGSLVTLMHWIRAEIALVEAEGNGRGWRGVIDGLRPHMQYLWDRLPLAERRRFLRHARPWWDVVRHRTAPQAADRIGAAIASGQLRVLAGRIMNIETATGSYRVALRRRGSAVSETLLADRLVDCTGNVSDPRLSVNPLVQSLLSDGQARPDPLALGLDVSADCALISRSGVASSAIFAIGPVTKARFWEIVAIPDIRNQAATLAGQLLALHNLTIAA